MTPADEWAELEALAREASPGAWDVSAAMTVDDELMVCNGRESHDYGLIATVPAKSDAAFIAAANPATILKLIEAARQSDGGETAGDGDWIEWHGGENPVPGLMVEIRHRSFDTVREHPFVRHHGAEGPSGKYAWGHDGSSGDIIAYRLAAPHQATSTRGRGEVMRAHSSQRLVIPSELEGRFDFDLLQPLSVADRAHIASARSGLIHALISVRKVIDRENPDGRYREIPLRFTRKRREAQRVTDALRMAEADIDRQQKGCADRLKADDFQKATPPVASSSPGTKAEGRSEPEQKPHHTEGDGA
jgi:hypothetical protein